MTPMKDLLLSLLDRTAIHRGLVLLCALLTFGGPVFSPNQRSIRMIGAPVVPPMAEEEEPSSQEEREGSSSSGSRTLSSLCAARYRLLQPIRLVRLAHLPHARINYPGHLLPGSSPFAHENNLPLRC